MHLTSSSTIGPILVFAITVTCLCCLSSPATAETADAPQNGAAGKSIEKKSIESSVVKIFATVRYPDTAKPWTKNAPTEVTGSGVVIEGKRILTNAHVVNYASQVQIQAHQEGDKISAKVEHVARGIDLAVLKLEDESFFEKHAPLPRASGVPDVKDPVMTYGYPTGGFNLSVTKGIISRIEFASYNYPVSGLRIQIDAAINRGNSGGPALSGDKMIGVAFSTLSNAQNIGYIIPNEEIELFLKDIEDGRYDGKPGMYDVLQTLENPVLKSFLVLPPAAEGVVVNIPDSEAADYPLKKWDLITRIGDVRIDNQGMIRLNDNLRVNFRYKVQHQARDGRVTLTVIRQGKELSVIHPVPTERPMLIDDLDGAYPPYFILGPVVFSIGSSSFSATHRMSGSVTSVFSSPLITRRGDRPAFDGEQLVVISSPFFPHKLAKGYANPSGVVVGKINGVAIRSLRHCVEVLRDNTDPFIRIEPAQQAESYVFARKEMLDSTEEILTDNGVRYQGSTELLAIWQARK